MLWREGKGVAEQHSTNAEEFRYVIHKFLQLPQQKSRIEMELSRKDFEGPFCQMV
jgi:hypothetical protein